MQKKKVQGTWYGYGNYSSQNCSSGNIITQPQCIADQVMHNCTECTATNGCYYCNSPGPINRCWANSQIDTCQYPNTSPGTNFQQKQTCSDPLSVFVNLNCSKFTNQKEWYDDSSKSISFSILFKQKKKYQFKHMWLV